MEKNNDSSKRHPIIIWLFWVFSSVADYAAYLLLYSVLRTPYVHTGRKEGMNLFSGPDDDST